MFLFKLLMDILLSHEHAVLLRSSPCCFPGKVRAVENRRDLTPRNVICDKLCISYISKGTEKEPKKKSFNTIQGQPQHKFYYISNC